MITEIGIVAGAILNLLEEKKRPVSLTEIKFYIDEPVDLINMSIGWLIRDDYVRIVRGSEKYLSLAPTKTVSPRILKDVEYASMYLGT